ncbi:MAG: 2-C-methyl-D-erythritol 2,4-cyclodiphosphate synthase [Candidatus Manganitrophaceae bacterium]
MIRIGIGYDVHRLIPGDRCILGGVAIPYDRSPEGYSDADVLLHAICDALLGASGEGDLGRYFPSGDPKWKGISSLRLLERTAILLVEKGFHVINIDTVVIAEGPKIAPHADAMKKNISHALSIDPEVVNIKATTNEKIGFIGRGEGIAAQAVCLIEGMRV